MDSLVIDILTVAGGTLSLLGVVATVVHWSRREWRRAQTPPSSPNHHELTPAPPDEPPATR